ncbi:MAG: hypothetical protein KJ941_13380, partial [Bacteroidetes bacterium]|nr:hypothetical protein [Bacteroidota bacterium]
VFVHHCKVDGKEQSLFVKKEHNCAPDISEKSCCHQELTPEKSKDCCNDEVKIVQVAYDYFQNQIQYEFTADFQALVPFYKFKFTDFVSIERGPLSFTNTDPPCPSGKTIVVKNQQFRC